MSVLGSRLSDFRLRPAPVDRFVRSPGQAWLRVPLGRVAVAAGNTVAGSRPDGSPSGQPRLGDPAEPRIGEAPFGEPRFGEGGAAAGERAASHLPLPFFWHDPTWYLASPAHGRAVAGAVSRCGVTIGMSESDLGQDEFAGAAAGIGTAQGTASPSGDGIDEGLRLRMAIHRCDRAGWTLDDCQSAQVIELRLGMERTSERGYEYEPRRFERWHPATMASLGNAGAPIPLLFPPEWSDLAMLGTKVAQLRSLGDAAIYVSCDESQIEIVLPAVCSGEADGILVRYHDDPVLALRRCREILGRWTGRTRPRVWLSGGELSVEEMVKCFALGASAIAIDAICDPWLTSEEYARLFPTQTGLFNHGTMVGKAQQRIMEMVRERLVSQCEELAALLQSLMVRSVDQLGEEHLIPVNRGC